MTRSCGGCRTAFARLSAAVVRVSLTLNLNRCSPEGRVWLRRWGGADRRPSSPARGGRGRRLRMRVLPSWARAACLTCVRTVRDSLEPADGALVVVDKDRRVAVDAQLFVVRIGEALVSGASCEKRVRPSFCLRPRGERGSADGTQRSQDDSDRHCGRGAGAAGVHGACLPVMRASTREEMRRISSTSRSSSRLFSIHSR